MNFRYFEAGEAEMAALVQGERQCEICGQSARCFDLSRATKRSALQASLGCVQCLHDGRFAFTHTTEVGILTDEGLNWFGAEPRTPPRVFVVGPGSAEAVETPAQPRSLAPEPPSDAALEELRRTPDFPTWNEVGWLVHCGDFMVYLGPWQPADFKAEAQRRGVAPGDLFRSAAEREDRHLWDDHCSEWGITYHVFRCTRCFALRGALDLD